MFDRLTPTAVHLAAVLCMAGASQPARCAAPETIQAAPATVTRHTGVFNGARVAYEAAVEPVSVGPATIVATTYTAAAPAARRTQRPVIFIFNGGPISPSVYLHMLALGPKRLAVPDDLTLDPAGFALVDNPYSPLDVADLVFYDPASTGYSRVQAGADPAQFFSVDADARQLSDGIAAWSRRRGRTDSPKYLFGESYGTLRAAVAAQQLGEGKGPVRLDGVFLMGQALNIIETSQRPGNITSYIVSLPTLAALGWHHGRVARGGRTFERFLDEVRLFARTEYQQALFAGGALDPAEEGRVAARLQAFTGLAAKHFAAQHLRVSKNQFRGLLLADQGLVLGANDGRYVARADGSGKLPDASARIYPSVFAAFDTYARDALQVSGAGKYVVASPADKWNYGGSASPFDDWPFMASINKAMAAYPRLRIMVGAAYHDTLTTTGAAEYAVAQSGWPRERVTLNYYQGGHMFYTIEASLQKMSADIHNFLAAGGAR
jgi:carboxypeptidase C (cathepsin A)